MSTIEVDEAEVARLAELERRIGATPRAILREALDLLEEKLEHAALLPPPMSLEETDAQVAAGLQAIADGRVVSNDVALTRLKASHG